jgi:hypothetical protein
MKMKYGLTEDSAYGNEDFCYGYTEAMLEKLKQIVERERRLSTASGKHLSVVEAFIVKICRQTDLPRPDMADGSCTQSEMRTFISDVEEFLSAFEEK